MKEKSDIMEVLEEACLHLKPSKFVWKITIVDILGLTAVNSKGIKMADNKI